MHLNFLRFLAVATGTVFIFGNVAAADWQPLPGGKEGTFYDVQSVINEKGNYHIIERQYIPKDRLASWGGMIMLWSNLPGHLNRWKIHHLRKKHDNKKT